MGLLGKLKQQVPAQREAGVSVEVEIVGESFHQGVLKQVARKHGDREFPIVLRLDPENEYDRNAVAVLVEGKTVGHLSRDMAATWKPMVEAQGGSVPGVGRLFGGTREKPQFGVFGSAMWFGADAPRDRWGGSA